MDQAIRRATAIAMLAASVTLVACGQQPERRVGEGEREREGGSASPMYRSSPRYGDAGPDAPSGGVKSGMPSANNPPAAGGQR